MGLPEVIIDFKSKGTSAIQRSSRGIVALILKDSTKEFDTKIYKGIDEVDKKDFAEANYEHIKNTFLGIPSRVIVERINEAAEDYNTVLQRLKNKKFNYLAVPEIEEKDVDIIAMWIKGCRDNYKKTFKAVLPKCTMPDHDGIINLDSDNIKDSSKLYKANAYCAKLAGALAGLPLSRSATNLVFGGIESLDESLDPNADIDAGKLILINDGENFKIARGVNSLVTLTATKGEDFQKIKIIEGMDLVRDDIRDTFEKKYSGKVINKYDNKILFIAAINSYFKELEKIDVLDPEADNKVEINLEAQENYLKSKGIDTLLLNEEQIKRYNTGTKLFLRANIKFVDAMEDLYFDIGV